MAITPVVAGTTIDPTTFGNAVVDALNRVGVYATRTTNQAIGAGAGAFITFPNEISDTDAFFTAGSDTFTIPAKTGLFAITCSAALSSGNGWLRLDMSGGLTSIYSIPDPGIGLGPLNVTAVVPLAAAATVKMFVFNGGGAANVTTAQMLINRVGL